MRVITGEARGRKLVSPPGDTTRPTSDKVREAIFNTLISADLLEGRKALDLFAGTGAMGIEAISRGVEHVTFLDTSRQAVSAIHKNLETCGFEDRATVASREALAWLRSAPAGVGELVFADPPYVFDKWSELLELLAARGAETVVIERGRALELNEDQLAAWHDLRTKRYGTTVVTVLLSRAGSEGELRVSKD